jgi:hypothetical protein
MALRKASSGIIQGRASGWHSTPVKDCRPAHLNRRDLAVERISGIIREIERQPPVAARERHPFSPIRLLTLVRA